MVRAHGDAIHAVEFASRMKLHVTTVRFWARCATRSAWTIGYSPRFSRWSSETVETRARPARRVGVQWAGRIAGSQDEPVAGQHVADTEQARDPLDRRAVLATEVFDRMGFDPELAAESEPMASLSADSEQIVGRERVIRLRGCPVRDLARAHPEVGCGTHLGLLQGLLDQAAAAGGKPDTRTQGPSARLDPFVEPELCIARLHASRKPTRDRGTAWHVRSTHERR